MVGWRGGAGADARRGVDSPVPRRAHEPVGAELETDARSTSKSAVSRTFVHRTRQQLWNLLNRPLAELRLAVMMLDGVELHGRANIVALGACKLPLVG